MLANIRPVGTGRGRPSSFESLSRRASPLLLLLLAFIIPMLLLQVSHVDATTKVVADAETTACLTDIDLYLTRLGLTLNWGAMKDAPDGPKAANKMASHGSSSGEARQGEDEALQMAQIRGALEEAKGQIELAQSQGDTASKASEDSAYWPLLRGTCGLVRLQTIIENYLNSLADCDQVSLDFLMIVANHPLGTSETTTDQNEDKRLVNEFARRRIDSCWRNYVSSFSRRLDQVLGKMVTPVFANMELLAEAWTEVGARRKAGYRSQDPVVFDEFKAWRRAKENYYNNDDDDGGYLDPSLRTITLDRHERQPEKFGNLLESFKEIDFEAESNVRDFALAIDLLTRKANHEEYEAAEKGRKKLKLVQAFYVSFFVEPCEELTQRVKSIVASGEIYRRFMSQTLGSALAVEKLSNPKLDYELQVYRICKLGLKKEETILGKLNEILLPGRSSYIFR